MSTSIDDLKRWFLRGIEQKAAYLIVVCDTFDHEDYPVYAVGKEDCIRQFDAHQHKNMQRVMEVYDLSKPWENVSARKWELPERAAVNGSEQ